MSLSWGLVVEGLGLRGLGLKGLGLRDQAPSLKPQTVHGFLAWQLMARKTMSAGEK